MNTKKQTATQHLFTNKQLRTLLVPIMVEQLLSSLMGTADTMMVSNVGSAAISAVSLVDAINILVIQALSALAAGGAILCSQYLGSQNLKKAKRSAEQVLFVMLVLSCSLSLLCLIFRFPLLRLIFGTVDTDVMANSQIYFFFTLLSFPFIGLYDAGASILRAQNNTKGPMTISILSNFLNIGGNAILIFVFGMGVAGAAISTLVSRIFCAIVVIWQLRNPAEQIYVRNYFSIRPDWSLIKRVLFIGIPSGIENSMFQFGKLAIQSTVSTLGTVAIAAQAMTSILEALNGIAAMGVGIGLMTVVGQCIGAKRKDEAIYYIKRLSWLSEIVILISCAVVYLLAKPVTILGGMEAESARLCLQMVSFITITKPISWVLSFIPAYGIRRCEVLHDYLLRQHVAVPGKPVHLFMPLLWLRSHRCLDRHVRGLERACGRFHAPLPLPQVAAAPCDRLSSPVPFCRLISCSQENQSVRRHEGSAIS